MRHGQSEAAAVLLPLSDELDDFEESDELDEFDELDESLLVDVVAPDLDESDDVLLVEDELRLSVL